MSWPSPTANCSEVSGANVSARLAPASGAMLAACLRRAAGKITVEKVLAAFGCFLLGLLEDRLMHRRQRAGGIGIAGIAGQRKGLAAATAEINLPELAAPTRLRHPARAAIAVEGFRVLPDPGDRMVRPHRFELQPGDGLGGVAGQDLARRRDVEELPAPAAHALLRPQRVIVGDHVVDRKPALQPLA